MRKLLKSEKEFINKILELKAKAKLKELQSARLLEVQLDSFGLEWTLSPKKTLNLYHPKDKDASTFYDMVDYLYFVKELEENKFIALLPYNFELKQNEKRSIGMEKFIYCDKLDKDNLGANTSIQKEEFYIDIVDMLEKYAKAVIYPLPLLQEFKNNEYKSLEEKYAEKQLNRVKVANAIAIIAVLITIILGLI
ncbi:MAG: hypothetical protein PHR53_02610 [Bacteroidales bacterium]|nr:hypothetical protein [Bacteroidales bacterium]